MSNQFENIPREIKSEIMRTIRRPPVEYVRRLAEFSLYIVADPRDPLWSGVKDITLRAYRPNAKDPMTSISNLLIGQLAFWPKEPADYEFHPLLYATMEYLEYAVTSSGKLQVRSRPVGKSFFPAHIDWADALLKGTRTKEDFLARFEHAEGHPDKRVAHMRLREKEMAERTKRFETAMKNRR